MRQINKKILFAPWSAHNRNWHAHKMWYYPLKKMFKEFVSFDPQEEMYNHGKVEMNRRFLEVVKTEQPDYIYIWTMWDEFYINTFLKIRALCPKAKIIAFAGDDDIKFENYTLALFPLVDYTYMTQYQFIKDYERYKAPYYPALGADIEKFRPIKTEKKYDVCFVGTTKGDRVDYMRYLLDKGLNMVIYGGGWDKYPEFKHVYKGKIDEEDFARLINETKVNICLSKNYFNVIHLLERFFEANACNSFVLTERCPGYFPAFKEGHDIVTFENKEELLTKIKKYLPLEKERKQIAERAYKKTIKSYSNQALLAKAFTSMEKSKKSPKSGLPQINKKIFYLTKADLLSGEAFLETKLAGVDYVGFSTKAYQSLPHKDYFQMHSLELTKKPVSICDSYYNSSLIGDYLTIALNYLYKFGDRSYFYDNLDASNVVVRKDFLLKNLTQFIALYEKKPVRFIDESTVAFTSIPLVRTKRLPRIPLIDNDHIVFGLFENELLTLKNQRVLGRNSYIYRLILYAVTINPQLGQFIVTNTALRSKNQKIIRVAKKLENFFNLKTA